MFADKFVGLPLFMAKQECELLNLICPDWTDGANPFDALSEAFVFGNDKNIDVEITVEDATLRFGEEHFDVKQGDRLHVSESSATFLSLCWLG